MIIMIILSWLSLTFVWVGGACACSVCFGGPSDDLANVSLRYGVMFLLAVVLVVLGLFAKFFFSIYQRTRLIGSTSLEEDGSH